MLIASFGRLVATRLGGAPICIFGDKKEWILASFGRLVATRLGGAPMFLLRKCVCFVILVAKSR